MQLPALHICATHEELSQKALEVVLAQQTAKSNSVYMFPAGRTPRLFYDLLVDASHAKRLLWHSAQIFMLDEYWEGEDFRHFILNFVERLPKDNRPAVHTLHGKALSWEKEAEDYEQAIQAAGGIDLCVIGVGPRQGHIGFNESGSSFTSRTRRVPLAAATIQTNLNEMERQAPPYDHALTVGIGTILDSRKIILLASGEAKAEPLKQLFEGKALEEYPVTALLLHKNVTVLADSKAAPRL